ncbi:MAG: hypothetical protein AB7V26_09540 [Lysobacterales bacterium]
MLRIAGPDVVATGGDLAGAVLPQPVDPSEPLQAIAQMLGQRLQVDDIVGGVFDLIGG